LAGAGGERRMPATPWHRQCSWCRTADAPHGKPARYVGETVVALRSLDILDRASATIEPPLGTPRELVMSRSGTLTSAPERVRTMYVCASSSK
jgi:hypothetical protein